MTTYYEAGIVARLDLPKQRATAPLSVILIKDKRGKYSTHLLNRETDSTFEGNYEMGFETGMRCFKERCEKLLKYSPEVYELAA